jgi:hypothetical protein
MHSSNLTIVFAPNTLYSKDRDNAMKSITDMQRVSLVFKVTRQLLNVLILIVLH